MIKKIIVINGENNREDKNMQLQPIIKAKMMRFRNIHELDSAKDSLVFEYYSNETILSNHQPNGSSISDELLSAVSIGGADDMGLDGLCIKLNGILIQSLDDAKDIITTHNSAEIEFIFIQSKYKDKFDSGEYAKFINGVIDFLGEQHYQPMNEKIKNWLSIKEYLTGNEIMLLWNTNPVIRLYYVVMGTWNSSRHIEAISNKFKDDITALNMYGDIFINYIDTERFKKICDDNDNQFSSVINVIDTFSLTAVTNVDNSSIILCTSTELMKLLITDDGILRKGLFNDNVRDYQGDTTINQDIYNTIKTDPESFVLMNNGVTIICSEIIPGNRKVTIRNPRIVNGCQTCSVLYNAYRSGIDISDIVLSGKIISTNDSDITNKIIRGTNRQNIVYDEAFECTRDFHKLLEELFTVLSENQSNNKIYYERRSKQFYNNTSIKSYQKVSFRILIQSFISIFLNEPHMGHKHESRLLQLYKGKIFIDTQSKLPYYVSSLISIKLDQILKKKISYKHIRTYKSQIQMIIRILAGGYKYDINNEKNIDTYCNNLLPYIYDDDTFKNFVSNAINIFNDTVSEWVNQKGEDYKYAIKDSSDFTNFLLDKLRVSSQTNISYRGIVSKIALDKYKHYYGFITNSGATLFFHSKDNPELDYPNLFNKDVLFDVTIDTVTKRDKAINVRLANV